jgi:hypothetical protein
MTSSSTCCSSSSAFVRIPCSSGSVTRLKLMMINNTERTSVSCSALEVILGQQPPLSIPLFSVRDNVG